MEAAASRELCDVFLRKICAIPNGAKINECLQCGTCSASCPTASAMEYSPREVIAALRARMLDRVLRSNTVWLCSSCYSCTVRCPAGIPFTDVMYELKRLGVKYGLYPKGTTNAVMAQAFVASVDRYGRNHEPELIRNYYLRTNPLRFLSQVMLGLRLLSRGRMRLRPHRIQGREELRRMMAVIEENASP